MGEQWFQVTATHSKHPEREMSLKVCGAQNAENLVNELMSFKHHEKVNVIPIDPPSLLERLFNRKFLP